jgi:transcriptional regulator with XRE-family HTH domain
MRVRNDPAVILGNELRHGRIACHKRQRDVAAEIGGSQSMVSRMELGRGSTVSLATWAAAAAAVNRRLVIDLVGPSGLPVIEPSGSRKRQCHRTITETARDGGWSAVTEIHAMERPSRIETILTRHERELAVVHGWDLVTDVGAAIDELQWSMERERRRVGEGWRIGGLVIVLSGLGNRRRMTEAKARLSIECPTLAADWFRALRRAARPMPDQPGVLWVTRDGGRLLPAPLVPGWMWISPDRGSRALRRRAP